MEKRDINKKQLQTGKLTNKPNPKTNKQINPLRTLLSLQWNEIEKWEKKFRCYTEITGLKR